MKPRTLIAGGLVISVMGVAVFGEEKIHAHFNVPAPSVTYSWVGTNTANSMVAVLRGFGPLDYSTVGARFIREVKG